MRIVLQSYRRYTIVARGSRLTKNRAPHGSLYRDPPGGRTGPPNRPSGSGKRPRHAETSGGGTKQSQLIRPVSPTMISFHSPAAMVGVLKIKGAIISHTPAAAAIQSIVLAVPTFCQRRLDIIHIYDPEQKIVSRHLARGNAKRVSGSAVRISVTARFTEKCPLLIASTCFTFITSNLSTPGNRYLSGVIFCKESRV